MFNPKEIISLPDKVFINTHDSMLLLQQLQNYNPHTTFIFPFVFSYLYRQIYEQDLFYNVNVIEMQDNQTIDDVKALRLSFVVNDKIIEDIPSMIQLTSEKQQTIQIIKPTDMLNLLKQLNTKRAIFVDTDLPREVSSIFSEYLHVTEKMKFCNQEEANSQQNFYDIVITITKQKDLFTFINDKEPVLSDFMLEGIQDAVTVRDEFWGYEQYERRPDWMRGKQFQGKLTVKKCD